MPIPISYNLRNLVVRRVSTLAAAVGIGLVVTVFILVLALAQGFQHALQTTGSPKNAIILRKGATSEITSGILRDEAHTLSVRPEIAQDSRGAPMAAPEVVVLVSFLRQGDRAKLNVVLRGTEEMGLAAREGLRLAEGRFFQKGAPELVVGRSLSNRLEGFHLGSTVVIKKLEWKVVGILEAGGNGYESEVWADAGLVQSVFGREAGYQIVLARLADFSKGGFKVFQDAVEGDPKLQLKVVNEDQFYADQVGMLTNLIYILGSLVTTILAVGGISGAMNTLYAAIGSRAREIATLRALGFRRWSILLSFITESLLISLAGGVLGCLFALPIHGISTGTTNWATFSELAFSFRITPPILIGGLSFALVLGVAGGLLPAVKAARLPITTGLRQN